MYAKIFSSLWTGSLRGKSHELLVFTNLLTFADQEGYVDRSHLTISQDTGLTEAEVRKAVSNLEAPDPNSRTPDMQGIRLERLDAHRDWGWRIINYVKYRKLQTEQERRERNRICQQNRRKALNASESTNVTACHKVSSEVTTPYASAYASTSDSEDKSTREGDAERPSIDEVLLYADKIGLFAWKARDWWHEMEACGWLDWNHRPVKQWRPALTRVKVKWEADGRPKGPPGTPGNATKDRPGYAIASPEAQLDRLAKQFEKL